MSLPIRFARSGELFVAYTAEGSAPPALVVTPGHFFHLEVAREWPPFDRFIDRLTSFSRVILLDRRGTGTLRRHGPRDDARRRHGRHPGRHGCRRRRAGRLDGQRRRRAHPRGCCLPRPFLSAYPPSSSSEPFRAGCRPRTVPPADSPEQHAWILRVFEERWGRAPVAMRTIAPGRADDPAFRRWYARVQRYSASPGSAIAWYRLSAEIDARRVLPTIRVPTLVLHRTGDMIVHCRPEDALDADRRHGRRSQMAPSESNCTSTRPSRPMQRPCVAT